MRRHGNKIVSKRGERFASNRANWMTYEKIEQMYDIIYDQMVKARVAVALDSPVFCDKHGNIVSKDEKYGKPNTIEITHPDYIFLLTKMDAIHP